MTTKRPRENNLSGGLTADIFHDGSLMFSFLSDDLSMNLALNVEQSTRLVAAIVEHPDLMRGVQRK